MNNLKSDYSAISAEMDAVISRAKMEDRDLTVKELKHIVTLDEKRDALAAKIVGSMDGTTANPGILNLTRTRPNLPEYMANAMQAMYRNGITNVSDLQEIRGILGSNSPGTISEAVNEYYSPDLVAPFELAEAGMQISYDDNYTKYPYQSGSMEPVLTGEASAIDASSLTVAAHQVNLQKFAVIQKCSIEVFEDAPLTVNMIAQSAAVGFSNALSRYVFDQVFANASVNTIDCTAIAATAFGYNNLLQGVRTLEAQGVNHRRTAFVSSPRISENLAKLTATDGQYIQPPTRLSEVKMLTTKAIRETYTSNTATKAVLGDFSQARLVVRGIGATVVPSNTLFTAQPNMPTFSPGMHAVDSLYLGTGEMAWLFYLRADVILHRPEAFVVYNNLKF